MSPPVRVSFRRTGGLAGLAIGVDTDTDALPPDHRGVVRSLIAGPTGAAAPKSPPAGAPGGPDRFTYQLELDDGNRRRMLRWPETQVPEAARPLIAELTSRAHPVS